MRLSNTATMSSDAPHASWHPALMPNVAPTPNRRPSLPPPNPPDDQAPRDIEPVIDSPEPVVDNLEEPVEEVHDKSIGPDAWFPEYEAGDNWLADASNVPPPSNEGLETPYLAGREEAEAESTNAGKHLSTMSFARTVSHDVSWADDEDEEPSLARVDTDPFKFMPPSDRTNSFPPVPPLNQSGSHVVEQPLPSSQAEDVIHEIEEHDRRVDSGADFASPLQELHEDNAFDDDDDLEGDTSHQYIGGDVHGSNEEASEARFTEGLPLISHDPEEHDSGPHNAFASEFAADEDDFFNQIQGVGDSGSQDPEPRSLERKSTAQVMDGLRVGDSFSNIHTVDEAQEEEEDEDEPPSTTAPPEEAAEIKEEALNKGVSNEEGSKEEGSEDLDAKWKAMFSGDDDEEFLFDEAGNPKEVDPAAFFGSDDEGFLDDQEDGPTPLVVQPTPQPQPAPSAPNGGSTGLNSRYLPPNQPQGLVSQAPTSYAPSTTNMTGIQPAASPAFPFPTISAPPAFVSPQYGAQPPRTEPKKAQSFVDKSKGGYTSPYDLPMDVVKPKKRVSMQNLQRVQASPVAPPGPPAPRSSSMNQAPLPSSHSVPNLPPQSFVQAVRPQVGIPKPPPPVSKPQEAFFEELPRTSKPRPTSRQSNKSLPSPSQASPYAPQSSQPPSQVPPPPLAQQYPAQPPPPSAQYSPAQSQLPPAQPFPAQSQPPLAQQYPAQLPPPSAQQYPAHPPVTSVGNLVAPERVSPYAPLQAGPGTVSSLPPTASNRYSPAASGMPHPNGAIPAAAAARYSPAPPSTRSPSASYTAAQGTVTPTVLPHQPRTSSPLAHFEVSHDQARSMPPNHVEASHLDRRSSYESRFQRVPSLPPTREVEEEESPPQAPPGSGYGQVPYRPRQPPKPASLPAQSALSPPKRSMSSYSPAPDLVPPARSQTQSPGALYGNRAGVKAVDPAPRPSSAQGPASPRMAPPSVIPMPQAPVPALSSTASRPRGSSQHFNLIPPSDGREQDPLQRWKGAPLMTWGLGGAVVTMFPKDIPRYGISQTVPMVVRSPGEVKVQNVKDIYPLEERLAKFPGPLKGKSKKKETLTWLSTGIEDLEARLPKNMPFQPHVSHEDKRAVERVLLWKILRLFVEYDGCLDGNATVEQAVRAVLSPQLGGHTADGAPMHAAVGGSVKAPHSAPAAKMHSDAVDPSAIEEVRNHLLIGAREKAVWVAADKRLWGHALLIANTVSPDLYKQVTQEFVRKEVNYPGHNNESLATLYEILSGNHDECVDELVPVHARAGLQLVAKDTALGPSKDAMEGLDKWQETLGLILSNRSTDDTRAMNSLGNLLSGYGRAEAAHICFIFARNHTVFGGLDDPASNFVLVGSDHKRQADQFAKEIEPLLLSEVYEYGLSLAGASNVTLTSPHLAAYKLQHALALAEYGHRQKALQYCEAILNAITSQTRRSPYHHIILEFAVDDLMKRLKHSPKEESSSWIPKPSMNKVSDSVWDRFNKFVSGEDTENAGQASSADGVESGPFARVVGGTPTVSRPPSSSGFEHQGLGSIPGYPMANGPVASAAPTNPPTRAASRYAPLPSQPAAGTSSPYEPGATYAPRASIERRSSEFNPASFESPRRSSEMQPGVPNTYPPNNSSLPAPSYQPTLSTESSYMPVSPPDHHVASQPSVAPGFAAPGYELHAKTNSVPNGSPYEPHNPAGEENTASVVNDSTIISESQPSQPPSYGYEPPSFTPYEPPAEKGAEATEETASTGYEPPSYQPYGYEPPSYEPVSQPDGDSDSESKPKPKKGIMYDDDDDDIPVVKAGGKSKEEKDRENAEMFRKAAEEDGKHQDRTGAI